MKTKMLTTGILALFVLVIFACGGGSTNEEAAEETIGPTGNPAIDGLTQEIQKSPNDPELYATRAEMFYQNEGYDEAIQDLSRALALDSLNIDYHHLLADVYLDYYKSRLALKTMERAAALYPNRIPTLLKLSEVQLILKKNEASMKTIERILSIDPQNAEAYFMFGMNFKETGDTLRAINSFQQAVEIDPDLIDGWVNLGQLHSALGNEIAGRFFRTAIEVAPNNMNALHAQAYYLAGQDDLTGALDIYRRMVRLDPQYEEAYFNSGLLYMDLDSLERARQQFDLAVKVDPTHVRAYYFRGVAAEMQGDVGQARADYQQVLKLSPDYQPAQEGLARLEALQ